MMVLQLAFVGQVEQEPLFKYDPSAHAVQTELVELEQVTSVQLFFNVHKLQNPLSKKVPLLHDVQTEFEEVEQVKALIQ